MTSRGAEDLKAAIRRSFWLIAVSVVVGVVAFNVLQQLRGAAYAASARVLISTTPISKIITGTEPSFVDPSGVLQTELSLAQSPEIYNGAAAATGGRFGSGSDFLAATRVSGGSGNNILVFTTNSSNPAKAVAIANAVASRYVSWRAEISTVPVQQAAQQLRVRLKNLDANDPSRSNLQEQLTRLELLQTLGAGDAVVIERATSASKTRPAPSRDSILGGAIGLLIGLLVAAIREVVDTKVRSEQDVEDVLGVPVLATVRSLPRRTRMVMYGRHERVFADTYALLAANLALARDRTSGAVIAITSAVPKEGKTSTAGNLAVALARRGARVLLTDFDLRRPMVGNLFGIPNDAPGLVQVLKRTAAIEDAAWPVRLNGPRPSVDRSEGGSPRQGKRTSSGTDLHTDGLLHVLPAGLAVNAEILSRSPLVVTLLNRFRSQYDFVLLDTPPALLTVDMAELGNLIDLVLLVVRQGHVSLRSLRSLGRQAQKWPAELVGAVLTDAAGHEEYSSYYRE